MAKKASGLMGAILVAGAALGVAKYLKDYAGAVYTDDEELSSIKQNAKRTRDAAKRTFVAIKEKKDIRESAEELYRSAGDVLKDSGSIAATAGSGAIDAAGRIKDQYSEDPSGTREEILSNLSQMKDDFVNKSGEIYDSIKGRFADDEETSPESDDSVSISDEE